MSLQVLSVASEAVPLVKTGGLADVVGALPAALDPHGVELTTLIPGYPQVLAAIGPQAGKRARKVHSWPSLLGEPARLLASRLGDHKLLVLDVPSAFMRDGGPYSDAAGRDWNDNWKRFALLARAAADLAGGGVKGRKYDVLHVHDWQAAMAPAYLKFAPPPEERRIPSVTTIHNIAFQGYFHAGIFPWLGLPRSAFAMDGVEFHGGVCFLKAGLEAADLITTVSPSYAAEIRQPEFGMGLEGLIASRGDRVRGILNGIDPAVWSPGEDRLIPKRYSARNLAKRAANKRRIEQHFGLAEGDGPLFVVVSRLTWQKGIDVILEVIDHLVGIGGRLAVLGTGDADYVAGLQAAVARHPGRVGLHIGYDEALSHLLQAGGDMILVPSRFEPCGLTQLYGLAYGCVPVVSSTGGLADTVIDANPAALDAGVATGIRFAPVDYYALASAISRANALYYQPETWARIQENGMAADFSWAKSGAAYARLYRELTDRSA